MLNERFDELSRKPDAQFLDAGAYESGLSPTTSTVGLGASVQEGKISGGPVVGGRSRRSARAQHGFGAAELDRAKKRMVASYERAYTERDKTESGAYVQEYVNHFLEDEPSPGIDYERKLVQALLPGITAAEVTAAAKELFAGASRVILATSPQKHGPRRADRGGAARGGGQRREGRGDGVERHRVDARRCMAARSRAGARSRIGASSPELGVTVVRFANGVEAWFKPTDFKNDQVLFSLVSQGGASLAPPEQFIEASLAPALGPAVGIGRAHAPSICRSCSPARSPRPRRSCRRRRTASRARSKPANLETALQLLYLEFTAPGDDAEAFALIKKQARGGVSESRARSRRGLRREGRPR